AGGEAAQIGDERYQRGGDLGADPGEHDAGAEEPHGPGRTDEVVGDGGVDVGDAGDVEDRNPGAGALDAVEEGLGDLLGPRGVDAADQRHDEDVVADRDQRGRELQQGGLVVAQELLLVQAVL